MSHGRSDLLPSDAACTTPLAPISFSTLALLDVPAEPGDPAVIRVVIQPLVTWLWIGGGVMGLGTALAAFPGKRRRPTEPTSSPAGDAEPDVKLFADFIGRSERSLIR